MARSGLASGALAILVVAMVVGASSLALFAMQGGVPTAATASTASQSSNGLRLSLAVALCGGAEVVSISEYNTLHATLVPALGSLPMIGGQPLTLGPCDQLPLGFAVLQGDYDSGNLSSASVLQLYEPGLVYSCPALFAAVSFSFAPLSDEVSLYSDQPTGVGNATASELMWTQPDSFSQSFSGYWSGQGAPAFHAFSPGVYTLVGADEFGQLAFVHFTVEAGTTSSSAATTSSSTQLGDTSVSVPSRQGLLLEAGMNASDIAQGQTLQVNVTEFNTLPSPNNVSASDQWASQVSLGPCRNIYSQPFGLAVYYGHVDSQNLSQGQEPEIYPIVACPQFIRLVTGYEFQPDSNLAAILPGSEGSSSPLVGSVDVSLLYGQPGQASAGQPLPQGTYTVVVADEWGAIGFLYFQVS